MTGEKLHLYDVRLCQHALDNVRGHLGGRAFAAYAKSQLSPPVWEYLRALGGGDDPAPLLLRGEDFEDLERAFDGQFDLPWVAYRPLYRRSIDCAREIRDALAGAYAQEWALASAEAARKLERGRTRLSDGIRAVHGWVVEARRLLRAMGAADLLPRPEGGFPTPSSPEPAPLSLPAESTHVPGSRPSNDTLAATITELRDLILNQRSVKEVYTTAEAAEILRRAEYTVREWCRKGQAKAAKAPNGRGWLLTHAELNRLRNHGPLPEDQAHRRPNG